MKPSHVDESGAPRMVDVGDKPVARRRAVAEATVRMRPDVVEQLIAASPKGDAFTTARLAGISAAKRTAELIPLCHPLPLDHVDVELTPDQASGCVVIRASATAEARTGVEMEALTAASIAALTLYDMAKSLQRDIRIERVELVEKTGGRSQSAAQGEPAEPAAGVEEAAVVTVSDRSAAGEREDRSGPALAAAVAAAGFSVVPPRVVADDEAALADLLRELSDRGHLLVLTTGGTGLGRRDVTPAATRRVVEYEVPGMAEQMRLAGMSSTPMASLSRGIVGVRGRTLIVNVPGSTGGALESFEALRPVLRHALEQLTGHDH
ncbi:MAG: bifunctional molybdenum cofactor biosynthesis protein MoaC/MoaB [Candidatus Limnocylindria bacterium]